MKAGRTFLAIVVSLVAIPVGLWAALVAALSLVQGLMSLLNGTNDAPWTRVLNPVVWIASQDTVTAGRSGSILDDLLGGPTAPGAAVSPFLTSLLAMALAGFCLLVVTWAWDQTRTGQRI